MKQKARSDAHSFGHFTIPYIYEFSTTVITFQLKKLISSTDVDLQ